MANGEALNPESLVGQVRLVVGDDQPDETTGDYTFSDDAITVALSLSNDGVTRAVAILVKQLALQASLAGQSIRADDFAINTRGRGSDLLEVAESYAKDADVEEAAANAGEYVIVNTRLNRPHGYRIPRELVGLLNFG